MNEVAKTHKNFLLWKIELDRLCKKLYQIDTYDMGSSDEELACFYRDKSTPQETAEHFGLKYNLTRAEEVGIRG